MKVQYLGNLKLLKLLANGAVVTSALDWHCNIPKN